MGGKGKVVDLHELHKTLWERANRRGLVDLVQKELAVELGVTHFTVSRLFHRLQEEGRIRKLVGHHGNTWTYLVRDPDLFIP